MENVRPCSSVASLKYWVAPVEQAGCLHGLTRTGKMPIPQIKLDVLVAYVTILERLVNIPLNCGVSPVQICSRRGILATEDNQRQNFYP